MGATFNIDLSKLRPASAPKSRVRLRVSVPGHGPADQASVLREAGVVAGAALAGGIRSPEAIGPTLTRTLARWGDPRELAADPQAPALLRSFGGHYLTDEKIQRVIAAARTTLGVRMDPWEARELRATAEAIVQRRAEIAACKKELKKLAKAHATIQAQKPATTGWSYAAATRPGPADRASQHRRNNDGQRDQGSATQGRDRERVRIQGSGNSLISAHS